MAKWLSVALTHIILAPGDGSLIGRDKLILCIQWL